MTDVSLSSSSANLLLQSITDYAIYMIDTTGVVRSWNAGAEKLKGYKPDEIVGKHFSRFYTPEDREQGKPANALWTALRDGRFEAEGWRVRKDGERFWANVVIDPIWDERGEHVGYAKITRDLSEKRAAEEALRRSEERFRLLVQGVTDYAIYMLDPNGRVSSWNAGAQHFKGYTADEIIGEHFSRFYPPEDRAAGVPQRALQTARDEGRFEAEGWRLRKDGSRFWASVVVDPIHDDDGKLIGFTKITRDLTERKKSQEALERSREQFFQAQKMEAIGQLTGGVAHDFNNLLAAILGSLNLAKRRMSEGEDVTRFLDNAIQAAQRGATLTQRMLAFARKQELRIEPVDLLDSVRGTIELLGRTIGSGVHIKTSFPANLPPVMADRAQLELALINLAVNARDAMPEGGDIVIAGKAAAPGEGLAGDQASICLSITDEGEGMDAETLSRAVEPFFTTKGVGKGTGLGLSMVQGMVEQCGGRLVLQSEPGAGTRAEIWLPAADCAERIMAEPVTPAHSRPLRILAVDDDPIVLLNTATILGDMGHHVLQADSGAAALALLETHEVDLLLTDYAMPQMSGAELVDHALQANSDLRVIVVSGYADLPKGRELEVPRLSKPFTDAELAEAIADATD
ncbi:MAG TPA: PAS domain S-box protein [Croceibacterium sp.]|nr:PAS domain S-box protein [Croceibacterium sp.]